jgi:hypothetical protein
VYFVAVEPILFDLHPGAEGPTCAQFFDSITDGLSSYRKPRSGTGMLNCSLVAVIEPSIATITTRTSLVYSAFPLSLLD